MKQYDDSQFPAIVFEVDGNLFSINSSRILNIFQSSEYRSIPKAPPFIRGMIRYMGQAIAVLDLRVALGMKSLKEELEDFFRMIDERKQDHINWVSALERTVRENEPFALATDHHKCALGRWRDQFQSDIGEINFQLKKLDDPHFRLHQCAVEILSMEQDRDCQSRQKILSLYQQARDKYMPSVLALLDETKSVFRSSVFRESILILNDENKVGLIVDKVLAVETLSTINDGTSFNAYLSIPCIAAVQQSEKFPDLILGLDVERLLEMLDGFQAAGRLDEYCPEN